ncbi:glycosyltransferase, partial [Bacillus mobilis]
MGNRFEKSEEAIERIPLVSVLIPTYNRPDYFEKALCSVLQQTYSNIEIIVGDDSTNDETENVLQKYLFDHSNIIYIKNRSTLGQFENALMLFNEANGEYINFLMDDD